MGTEKTYTDKQLLELDSTDGLSVAQIERRGALLQMQANSVDLEKRSAENQKYLIDLEHRQRQQRAKMQDIARADAEEKRTQSICKHLTGGMDRKGFYAGTGDIYGACISKQQLPTGEHYALCARCGREYHHPRWVERYYPGFGSEKLSGRVAVVKGAMSLGEYLQMEREYNWAMQVEAKTFETPSGEIPAPIMFRIPQLQERMDEEERQFKQFLSKVPPEQLQAAKIAALGIQ